MMYCVCMPAMWSTSVCNPGMVWILDSSNCVASHTETRHTQSIPLSRREVNRVNSAGGMMGAHMLSSQEGTGSREQSVLKVEKVHSLMLDVYEIKHLIELNYLFFCLILMFLEVAMGFCRQFLATNKLVYVSHLIIQHYCTGPQVIYNESHSVCLREYLFFHLFVPDIYLISHNLLNT